MKQLKNYKIEPQGLNEAILHKAVDEGYENKFGIIKELKTARYLYFCDNGSVMHGQVQKWFEKDPGTQISAHDFLRLNWTPKVGEEVECVDSDSFANEYIQKSKKYKVIAIWKDVRGIKVEGAYIWFDLLRFIPIYPKKEQPKEKSLTYDEGYTKGWAEGFISGQSEEKEKPDACLIGFCGNDAIVKSFGAVIHVPHQNLHDFKLISEQEYDKIHPDKLMFKGWEVKHDSPRIHIGCITTTEFLLRTFLRETEEASDKELDSVTLLDLRKFLIENKEKFNLKVTP